MLGLILENIIQNSEQNITEFTRRVYLVEVTSYFIYIKFINCYSTLWNICTIEKYIVCDTLKSNLL